MSKPETGDYGTSEQRHRMAVDARKQVISVLTALPYAGAVPMMNNTRFVEETDETTFLQGLSQALANYGAVTGRVQRTVIEMQDELTDLRDQRTAVRRFLGLPALSDFDPR